MILSGKSLDVNLIVSAYICLKSYYVLTSGSEIKKEYCTRVQSYTYAGGGI